ncbi:uncharacterized protein LOC119400905 [Rhipicephalus sanguineus]|uniref:uncharacterized protein LOC119400905 n=1 Tax=Rhipicephalus sanguineus TaxID=34632 RepID=UPI00189423AF|nr:uncharacterized protein LOC119400905 [Rhipicephalus sanguineus]
MTSRTSLAAALLVVVLLVVALSSAQQYPPPGRPGGNGRDCNYICFLDNCNRRKCYYTCSRPSYCEDQASLLLSGGSVDGVVRGPPSPADDVDGTDVPDVPSAPSATPSA